MPTTHEISLFDQVELLEPAGTVHAGATGAVLEFRQHRTVAMVEFTSMPPAPALDRIEFVPVDKLRRLD